jgi:hypothetical protein
MSNFYRHCPECRKRMKRFRGNPEQGQLFYFCPACATRGVYLPDINGWSAGWPAEVFNDAVDRGVLTKKGGVASTRNAN